MCHQPQAHDELLDLTILGGNGPMHAGPKGKSVNPLKQVLDAVDETIESTTYDRVSQSAWQSAPSRQHFVAQGVGSQISFAVMVSHE